MRNVSGWSLLAVVCMVSVALAQARTEPRTQPRPGAAPPGAAGQPQAGQPGAAGAQGSPDQQIAAKLQAGARNEVELGKFAQQHAKSDSVKDFAAMMVKDHSQQVEKLGRLAGNLASGNTGGGSETRRETRRVPAEGEEGAREEGRREEGRREEGRREEGRREEGRREEGKREEGRREEGAREEGGRAKAKGGDRAAGGERERPVGGGDRAAGRAGGAQQFSWVAIHKQIADQCLTSTKEELGKYKGDDFDKAYMGQQIVAHMQMVDELKVFKNYATGQLQQEIESGIESAEHHLDQARQIMEKQKDQGSEGDSGRQRKPGDSRE